MFQRFLGSLLFWVVSVNVYALDCFKTEYQKLDLNAQMGATRSQIGGTCFAYQGAAVVQAALFRNRSSAAESQCEISPEACAFELCESVEPEKRKSTAVKILLESEKSFESFSIMDGSSKNSATQVLTDLSQKSKLAIDTISLRKELSQFFEKTKISQKEKDELFGLIRKHDNLRKKNAKKEELKEVENKIEQRALEVFQTPCESVECGRMKARIGATVNVESRQFKVKTLLKADANWKNNCIKQPKVREKVLKEFSEALCSGLPIAIDSSLVGGFYEINKGTYSQPQWEKLNLSSVDRDSYHAMVIKGFERENGVDYLTIRNSWGSESELRIKTSDVCQIMEAAILGTQDEINGLGSENLKKAMFDKTFRKADKTLGFLKEQSYFSEPSALGHK